MANSNINRSSIPPVSSCWNNCPICNKEMILIEYDELLKCESGHYVIWFVNRKIHIESFCVGKYSLSRSPMDNVNGNWFVDSLVGTPMIPNLSAIEISDARIRKWLVLI